MPRAGDFSALSTRARNALLGYLGEYYWDTNVAARLDAAGLDERLRTFDFKAFRERYAVGPKTFDEVCVFLGVRPPPRQDHDKLASSYWTLMGDAYGRQDYVETLRLLALLGEQITHLRRRQREQERLARVQRRTRPQVDEAKRAPFDSRNWAIFHFVVLDGRTIAETGRYFRLSRERARQIAFKYARMSGWRWNYANGAPRDLDAVREFFADAGTSGCDRPGAARGDEAGLSADAQ